MCGRWQAPSKPSPESGFVSFKIRDNKPTNFVTNVRGSWLSCHTKMMTGPWQ